MLGCPSNRSERFVRETRVVCCPCPLIRSRLSSVRGVGAWPLNRVGTVCPRKCRAPKGGPRYRGHHEHPDKGNRRPRRGRAVAGHSCARDAGDRRGGTHGGRVRDEGGRRLTRGSRVRPEGERCDTHGSCARDASRVRGCGIPDGRNATGCQSVGACSDWAGKGEVASRPSVPRTGQGPVFALPGGGDGLDRSGSRTQRAGRIRGGPGPRADRSATTQLRSAARQRPGPSLAAVKGTG